MTARPEKRWWVLVRASDGLRAGSSVHEETLVEFVAEVAHVHGIDWGVYFDVRHATEEEVRSIPPWVVEVGKMKAEVANKQPTGVKFRGGKWSFVSSPREIYGWSLMLSFSTGAGKPHFQLIARKSNGEIATVGELNFVGAVLSCLGAIPPPTPVNGAPAPDGTWRFIWHKNGEV
jgi:hypothetical protein